MRKEKKMYKIILVLIIVLITGCVNFRTYKGEKRPRSEVVVIRGMSSLDISAVGHTAKVCAIDKNEFQFCKPFVEFLPGERTLKIRSSYLGMPSSTSRVRKKFRAGDIYYLGLGFSAPNSSYPFLIYDTNVNGLPPAPESISSEARVEGDVYVAKDESFSVKYPFNEGSPKYTYMFVSENYNTVENRVQFSSERAPAEIYRIHLFKNMRPEEQPGKVTFEQYRQQFESAYKTSFKNLQTQNITISGVPAVLSTYSQRIPKGNSPSSTTHELNLLHSCLYIEKNTNAAFIGVHRTAPGTHASSEGSEARVEEFIKSFQLK